MESRVTFGVPRLRGLRSESFGVPRLRGLRSESFGVPRLRGLRSESFGVPRLRGLRSEFTRSSFGVPRLRGEIQFTNNRINTEPQKPRKRGTPNSVYTAPKTA